MGQKNTPSVSPQKHINKTFERVMDNVVRQIAASGGENTPKIARPLDQRQHVDWAAAGAGAAARVFREFAFVFASSTTPREVALRKLHCATSQHYRHIVQEGRNKPFCPSQEKFHTVVFQGVRRVGCSRVP